MEETTPYCASMVEAETPGKDFTELTITQFLKIIILAIEMAVKPSTVNKVIIFTVLL